MATNPKAEWNCSTCKWNHIWGIFVLKLPVTEARCLCFSISYLLRNMGLTYCCRWTLQGCTVELGERWHTIRHRLGSWWLCWLLSLCFTCGWRAKEISESGRTKGQTDGQALLRAGKCRRPGRRTVHKQHSSSVQCGVNLCTVWDKGVNYSSKWNGHLRCVPGEESSLPAQPIPGGHQRCGRRLAGFPGSTAQHEVVTGWEEAISQVWGQTHTDVSMSAQSFNPLATVPCSFHQLWCWLCQDSHSLGAGQDINLTEQWLDSHIFSAEHSINLIKQQITKPDESYDSGPNSVALSGSWKSFPLTFVMGERKHSRGGGCGDNLFLCIQGSGCLEWKDAVCTMAR